MRPLPLHPAPTAAEPTLFTPLCSVFRRFLKRQGLKFTPERAIILDVVLAKDGVFEAERLLEDVRRSERRVSKATIYRTLKHLVDAGILREVLLDPRQSHYEVAYGRKPKGHLVCVESGRVEEFDAPELDALRDRVCRSLGYDAVSHRFVIYAVPQQPAAAPS